MKSILSRLLVVILVALAAAGAWRYTRPLPAINLSLQMPPAWSVPPAPEMVPLPSQGSFFLRADSGEILADEAGDISRPIASVAKTMTALTVLDVHPLLADEAGPTISIGAQDVADYQAVASAGGSYLPVKPGQRFSERDLLYALMLPSANNIALTLARWIDGSVPAFVAHLNRTAAAMGLSKTHFTDPSGFDPGTVSSARDLVALARVAFAVPAFRQIVGTVDAKLGNGTEVHNLNLLLTSDPGWLGIKTGWTGAADGCLLFAVQRHFSPTDVKLIFGAVLGQGPNAAGDAAHPELGNAFLAARAAATAALDNYVAYSSQALGGEIRVDAGTPWGKEVGTVLDSSEPVVILRRGETVNFGIKKAHATADMQPGTTIADVHLFAGGRVAMTWHVDIATAVAPPSIWWRLTH